MVVVETFISIINSLSFSCEVKQQGSEEQSVVFDNMQLCILAFFTKHFLEIFNCFPIFTLGFFGINLHGVTLILVRDRCAAFNDLAKLLEMRDVQLS